LPARVGHSGADEIAEERMRARGSALELRMELRRHKPGMVFELDDLHELVIRRAPANQHARALHAAAVGIIELVAMAVALKDDRLAIGPLRPAPWRQAADPLAQAHCAA